MFMGIDGGGTHLRVAVCDADMRVLALGEYGSANPSSIGKEAAAERIHHAIGETLERAALSGSDIRAVGVGIAGAAADHASAWLTGVIGGALPGVFMALSSDFEIALVGAHGRRCGLLVLAGTGSAVFGINAAGASAQVGGWGYLLGDEGSGYWIGREALRSLTYFADGRSVFSGDSSRLPQRMMETLKFDKPKDLIAWLYAQSSSRVTDVARLAPLVLEAAASGDAGARQIVEQAAEHLADMARTVQRRLDDPALPVAFAGGLLEADTLLRRHLCELLSLSDAPAFRYPPVVGAALLAKLRWLDAP
ncbi:MAG: BadF/BadG/BcrA/BcrD ATPase family protein [Anaerolineae bacterium]